MKENSLFAILLRSPWWISFLIAAVIGLAARAALPEQFSVYAAFAGVPFLVIGFIAAWQQSRRPSAALSPARSTLWQACHGAASPMR